MITLVNNKKIKITKYQVCSPKFDEIHGIRFDITFRELQQEICFTLWNTYTFQYYKTDMNTKILPRYSYYKIIHNDDNIPLIKALTYLKNDFTNMPKYSKLLFDEIEKVLEMIENKLL